MECKFANLTVEQVAYLVSADIDQFVISRKKMREVEDMLDLNNDETDLMAVRNSVVDILGTLTSKAIERGNVELYSQLNANMSGITATIDNIFMTTGRC